MARCCSFALFSIIALTFLEFGRVESTPNFLRKRQLVVGRVGFRPGRSLAIGRGAFFRPGGKRSAMEAEPIRQIRPLAFGSDDVVASFRDGYCSAERQEAADALFTSIVQGMQELRQFSAVCYGTDDQTEYQGNVQPKSEDPFEYVTENI